MTVYCVKYNYGALNQPSSQTWEKWNKKKKESMHYKLEIYFAKI
jgi:hypothetical protein